MTRRIDIELTSSRDDGTWTWRAPGARQPRGSLEGTILPDGAKVGDVLRADAEFDLDGIVVTSVLAPKDDPRTEKVARIEIIGSGRDSAPGGVSVVLAPGGRRRDEDGRGERPRRAGSARGAPPRRNGASPGEGRDPSRAARPGRDGRPTREARPARPDRATPGDRPERSGRDASGPRSVRPDRSERPRRLQTVSTYRNAALAELRPEQLPVAEQLLRGGIPAVRNAIDEQNARARSEGRAEVSPDPLLTMAEELLPRMTLAGWKDRAVAARNAGKEAPLREVRSVVASASTVSLDDEGREMMTKLRDALQTRVTALRDGWLARIVAALDTGRVADALRVSARPPEPAARVPADMAVRLAEAASSAMSADVAEDEWKSLLDAVIDSPVRRTVKPVGLPDPAGEELRSSVRRAAGQVPELARLLGLPIPPPPGPRRPSPSGARGA
ncbi:MAG TPA: hypothetical protein VMU64_04985 [Acidimicrobiales bacterium]|nr:hypothetical protein [Acidimicrobiales bacterium]